MKTVRFINFWKTSPQVQNGFFKPMLEQVYGEGVDIISEPDCKVDLEVYSVFPPTRGIVGKALTHFGLMKAPKVDWFEFNPMPNSDRKIWFTGENIRPPLHLDFDAYLSFDSDVVDTRNIYMPLWILNIDWFDIKNVHGFAGVSPTQDDLLKRRSIGNVDLLQKKFCVSFIGNPENTRLSAVKFLSSKGNVDLFGRINGTLIDKKIDIGSKYKFILAFENTVSPGYVTEKLLEAHLSGAIPIYWGLDIHEYFNKDSYINFADFESFNHLADYVAEVSNNKILMEKFLSEPIMNKPFPMAELVSRVKSALSA